MPVRVADELPRIKHRRAYLEGLSALPDWRITCFFVDGRSPERRPAAEYPAVPGVLATRPVGVIGTSQGRTFVVFQRQKSRDRGRGPLSYANVVASVALFIALGGTAAAAVTLGRDSVGAREIREDAVRSSELRDEGVRIADISPGAQSALLGELHVEERDLEFLDTCAGRDITVCPNHAELDLGADAGSTTGVLPPQGNGPGRNWLIQAKLQIGSVQGDREFTNRCGLVRLRAPGPAVLLDEVQFEAGDVEIIALSGVVKKPAGDPTIALRCTEQPGTEGVPGSADVVNTSFVKITALEVGAITGP